MRSSLVDYCNIEVCDLLEFGFSLGCNDIAALLSPFKKSDLWMYKNHRGADDFPKDIYCILRRKVILMQYWVLLMKIHFSQV